MSNKEENLSGYGVLYDKDIALSKDADHFTYEGTVKPKWIDINGHMNVAYYLQAFDVNSRDLFEEIGFDGDYFQSGYSCFAIEDSLRYMHAFLKRHCQWTSEEGYCDCYSS